jgi:DNA-binding IclR family transcriptional regulator
MSSSILDRCFIVAEVLSHHRKGLSLGEIAEQSAMPKSAAHRMLSALADAGYVVQLGNRDYKLTLKLPAIGLRYLSNTSILQTCQPVLDALADETGELVRMALAEGEAMTWIAKAQGARSGLRVDPVMGQPVALHATATGKVWLASLSRESAMRIVFRDGFGTTAKDGPKVMQSVDALMAELDRTAARGYGLADEEAEPGISAIAVGIADSAGTRVLGTLSVAGPSVRLTEARRSELLPALQLAVRQFSGLEELI